MGSLTDSVVDKLKAAGLADLELVSSSSEAAGFGDAEAIFEAGSMLLRFVRDRGQEFLDIASVATPTKFFQFGDVEIAMGWKTIDEVLAKQDPEPLEAVLARLAAHFAELNSAFSGERERLTGARVEHAARDRGQVFVDRLQGKT